MFPVLRQALYSLREFSAFCSMFHSCSIWERGTIQSHVWSRKANCPYEFILFSPTLFSLFSTDYILSFSAFSHPFLLAERRRLLSLKSKLQSWPPAIHTFPPWYKKASSLSTSRRGIGTTFLMTMITWQKNDGLMFLRTPPCLFKR